MKKRYCISKSGNDSNSGVKPWCWLTKRLLAVAILLCLLPALAKPQAGRIHIFAQTGGACGTGVAHCTVLSWAASTTSGVTYSVYRGTISGGESSVPQNNSPITGLSYIDPITLTSSPQTFFYYVEAVETSSGITVNSLPSGEASVTFPGTPAPPTLPVAVPH